MSFRLHGKYCGPGWSAGQWQPSVAAGPPPEDALDLACARHDAAYATGGDLAQADSQFFRDALVSGTPLGVAAALGVGGQGLLRRVGILSRGGDNPSKSTSIIDNSQSPRKQERRMARGRIQRGIQAKSRLAEIQLSRTRYPQTSDATAIAEIKTALGQLSKKITGAPSRMRRRNAIVAANSGGAVVSTAPVSIGTTISAAKPNVVNTANGVQISGREFMTNVDIRGNPSWQVGAIAPVHPMYYIGSTLANMARSYQSYRFKALRVHFITRQSTSLAGEVLLGYASNALEPLEDGNGSAFIARSMTRGHAVLGPLWQNCAMDVPVDPAWRLVDAFNNTTFAENVAGEVQVYTQTGATNDVAGYLLMDYVVEFRDTMFSPHSALLPFANAASVFELGTVPITPAATAIIIASATSAKVQNGSVFKVVFDLDQSTLGTGWTASTAFNTSLRVNATTTTSTGFTTGLTLSDGVTWYGVSVGSSLYVYGSYEAAVNGEGSGQIFAQTPSSTATTLAYSLYQIRLSDRALMVAN
nr:structural protein [Tolivirales sp.]